MAEAVPVREAIAQRGDNLDIAWLKDESDESNGDQPDPLAVARDAMAELEGALEDLRAVVAELGEEVES